MKKITILPVLLLFVVACTTGKELPKSDYPLVHSVNFSADVTRVVLFSGHKDYLIIFSSPVSEKNSQLEVIFSLPVGKQKIFLDWTETGEVSEELLKYVRADLGRNVIKDRTLLRDILRSIYAHKAFSFPFFYVLGENGHVAEIQGIDDYLRLQMAARQKKLPDLSFFRQQITLASMRDVFGIKNESSKILGSKLGFKMPFFLAVDDIISGLGMAKDVWLSLTRDTRAQKLLDSTASHYDRCMVILTDPGRELLFPSLTALQDVLATCNQYIQKKNPEGAEFVRIAKAEGRAFNVMYLKHRKKFSGEEALQIVKTMKKAQKYARNRTERAELEFTLKLAQNVASK